MIRISPLQASIEVAEDIGEREGSTQGSEPPVKVNTPRFVTMPPPSDIKERTFTQTSKEITSPRQPVSAFRIGIALSSQLS